MSLAALQKENEALQKRLRELEALAAKKADAPKAEEKKDEEGAADKAAVFELFKHYDQDQSGFIDHDEFNFLAYDLGILLSDEELLQTVKEIDTSGDQKISADEFFAWYKAASEAGVGKKAGSQYLVLAAKLKLKVLSRKVNQIAEAAKKTAAPAGGDEWSKFEYKFEMGQFDHPEAKIDVEYNIVKPEDTVGLRAALGAPNGKLVYAVDFLVKEGIGGAAKGDLAAFLAEINAFIGAKLQEVRQADDTVDKISLVQVEEGGKLVIRLLISVNIDPIADIYRGLDLVGISRDLHLTLAFKKAASCLLNGGCFADFLDFHFNGGGEQNSDKFKQIKETLKNAEMMLPPGLGEQMAIFAMLKGVLVDIKLGSVKDCLLQFNPAEVEYGYANYHYMEYRKFREVMLSGWDAVKPGFVDHMTEFYHAGGHDAEREGFQLRKYYNWVQQNLHSIAGFQMVSSTGLTANIRMTGIDIFAYLPSAQDLIANGRQLREAGHYGYDEEVTALIS